MDISVYISNNEKSAITYAGQPAGPFTVSVSAPCIGDYKINLCAYGSRAYPYEVIKNDTKKFLIPTWKFTNESGDIINSINLDTTVIYDINNNPIGVTGQADFYYIDDMPTAGFGCNKPVMIETSLTHLSCDSCDYNTCCNLNPSIQQPGFNTDVALVWINGWIPEVIKITRNGIDPINNKIINTPINWYITLHSYENDGSIGPIIFGYPEKGRLNVTHSIEPNVSAFSCPVNLFFDATDLINNKTGGYANGVYTALTPTPSAQIVASISFDETAYSINDFPYVYISNPNNNSLTIGRRIPQVTDPDLFSQYTYNDIANAPDIEALEGVTPVFYDNQYDTPYLTELDTLNDEMGLTGFGGIYGFAVIKKYRSEEGYAWVTDSELDMIYKINTSGVFVSSIQLSSGSMPAGIALDGTKNKLYFTSYDIPTLYQYVIDTGQLNTYSIINGDYFENELNTPPVVDTDMDNNLWVAYSNSNSSYLLKFDSLTLQPTLTVTLPQSSTPVDVLVQPSNNSIWVSLPYSHIPGTSAGEIRNYSENGTLLQTVTGIKHPGYLAIDDFDRIWYSYNLRSIACIAPANISLNFTITSDFTFNWLNNANNLDEQMIEGIACDDNNILWVINSHENYTYTANLNLTQLQCGQLEFQRNKIIPDDNNEWYNDSGEITTRNSEYNKSAQAFCDWTGSRWHRKYFSTNTGRLSGTSNTFSIFSDIPPIELRRFNESWDLTENIRSYAIAPHINSFYSLWENFIGNSVGGTEPGQQQVGRRIYEKIANFIKNHNDVDICNIDQLYSLANYLDVPIDDYNLGYPPEVSRLVDIASVNHAQLIGEIVKCDLNITNNDICPRCGYKHSNLGEKIENPLSYEITAGIPFIIHNKFGVGQYAWDLVTPSYSGDFGFTNTGICDSLAVDSNLISSYPLTSLNFTSIFDIENIFDISTIYEIYNYIPGYPVVNKCDGQRDQNVQATGIINWLDRWTNIKRNNNISTDSWYDDDGIIQTMFEYELLRGLQVEYDCEGDTSDSLLEVSLYVCTTAVCTNIPQTYKAYITPQCSNGSCADITSTQWYTNENLQLVDVGGNTISTFRHALTQEGLNEIFVIATDALGRQSTSSLVISAYNCCP